jgi:hypothetical protein
VSALPRTVSIPARFNGPPASANGGYTCGTLARLLGTGPAEVTLRRPPPLERPLAVEEERDAGVVRLRDGETTIVEARRLTTLDGEPPRAVSLAAAREAMRGFPWYHRHPFPTCFVCGPAREGSDGLDIFAGAVRDSDVFACPWTPATEWGDGGSVRTEVVWAALDCPSAVAAAAPAGGDAATAVLARLSASIDAEVPVGEPHAVVSWPLSLEGRKRVAGSAILSADGSVLARASALWIELRE